MSMELTVESILQLYYLLNKNEKSLSNEQYSIYLNFQKYLYKNLTIEQMEKINNDSGGIYEC